MFQLIVAVISIALVAALAIASIYYGGSAFSSSSLRANVVTLVNAGQQISGAQALYKTDNGIAAASIAALSAPSTTGVTYLSAEPGKSSIVADAAMWEVSTTEATIALKTPLVSSDVCKEVARQAGNNGQFGCDGVKGFFFKL
jgi:hypothetical protein